MGVAERRDVQVLLRLSLTTRLMRLDSSPPIDLCPLTPCLMRLDSSPPIDLLSLTPRLKCLDSLPPIDLLPLLRLRDPALRRELRALIGEGLPRECG
jgi:hypothetical protein